MTVGLVVVWCGQAPCWYTLQLGDRPLVLGRDLLDSLGLCDRDQRISGQHAKIVRTQTGFAIEDLGSRNGTFLGGDKISARTPLLPPAVVRVGQTVALAVGDVGYYAKTPVHAVNDLVVGPSSQQLLHRLEVLARGDAHVALIGMNGSGRRELAKHYARARQLPFVMFDPHGDAPLSAAIQRDTKTLIFPEIEYLKTSDRNTLVKLLDRPGLRVVSTSQTRLDEPHRKNPPLELARRLQGELVRVPVVADRIEEVPLLVSRVVEREAPRLTVHVTAIEWSLTYSWPGNWLELVHGVTRCAHALVKRRATELHRRDLEAVLTKDHVRVTRRRIANRRDP